MEYLGNFLDKQPEGCIEHFLNTKGKVVPDLNIDCFQQGFSEDPYHHEGFYMHPNQNWEVFEHVSNNLEYDMYFPLDYKQYEHEVQIIKMLPGNYLPSHRDPMSDTTHRYVMALSDYEIGHVLIWGNDFLQNYKKGDTWKITDINLWHASGNLGYTTRLFAHLTMWGVR